MFPFCLNVWWALSWMTSLFSSMFNEIPKSYILNFWLPWILFLLSFMISMVMSRALASNAFMMPWCILLSWSYKKIEELMIKPICEGYHLNHSGDLLFPFSLAPFSSTSSIFQRYDLSFHNLSIALFCLVWGLSFPYLKCLSPLTFNTFSFNLSFSI